MAINVKVTGIDEAIKALKAKQKELSNGEKFKSFLTILGGYGVEIERATFNASDAYKEMAGPKTLPQVQCEVNGNKATVSASGVGILFIEFGTGDNWNPPNAAGLGYGARTWSNNNMHAIQENGTWIYRGPENGNAKPVHTPDGRVKPGIHWTSGNPGAGATYVAAEAMRDGIVNAFRTAFM